MTSRQDLQGQDTFSDLEEGDLTSTSTSCSSADLAPRLKEQFQTLSSVLNETNQNLLSFEFMLKQSRQLARITPLLLDQNASLPGQPGDGECQTQQTEQIEKLIHGLNDAVAKVAALRDQIDTQRSSKSDEVDSSRRAHLEKENRSLTEECRTLHAKILQLESRNSFLEMECQKKAKMCDQLMESVHRARGALEEEREEKRKLDQKLENEHRAAKKIGQDIVKYVEKMEAMEEELDILKKEKKRKALNRSTKVEMEGETLTAVVEKSGSTERELQEEVKKRKLLEVKVSCYENQIKDYENQLEELKGGLETLQKGLEDKYQQQSDFQLLQVETEQVSQVEGLLRESRLKLENNEIEYKNLKAKAKRLLKQYNERKDMMEAQRKKIDSVKEALKGLLTICTDSEDNYRSILCHLGSEIEVSARLMAAYLDIPFLHEPIQLHGRKLAQWFCDVQALSAWLHKQLVAFGKRIWTDKEPPWIRQKIVPLPDIPMSNNGANTLSELSVSIDLEDFDDKTWKDKSVSIRETISAQDEVLSRRVGTLEQLVTSLKD